MPVEVGDTGTEQGMNDADFIAHSKQDIESLLSEVERLIKIFPTKNDGDGVTQEDWDQIQQENSRLKEVCLFHKKAEAEALKLHETYQRYRTALEKYGRHTLKCNRLWVPGEKTFECTCGFSDALLPREGK